jgi:hypothetical protein
MSKKDEFIEELELLEERQKKAYSIIESLLGKYPFEDDDTIAEFRRTKSDWINAVNHFQNILDDIA